MSSWDSVVGALVRRRALALVVGAVLVLGSAALAPGLRFSSDVTEHMPKVSPQVTAWLDLSRRFDAFNSLIVGLEEPGEPLSAQGLSSVKRVTDALAALKAQGVLSVSSVTNVESIHEGEDGALETELLVPAVPADAEGLAKLGRKIAADLQVSGALISRDQRGYMVLVRADERKDPAELAALVQRTVEENKGPLTSAYFGAAFFSAVITRGVYAKLAWLVPAFTVLLVGALLVLVRRARAMLLVLGCAAASLVVWLGLVRGLGLLLSFTSLTGLLGVLAVGVIAFARALDAEHPLPFPVAGALVAVGVAGLPLKLLPFAYVSNFGLGLALGAVAVLLVGLFLFAPASGLSPATEVTPGRPPALRTGWVLAVAAVALVAGFVAARTPFHATPQAMFTETDEIGRSLAFFDRRFGGPDFVQVDFRGDLRDPDVAARLMRLTDLLEGSQAFPDVRSVTQVLGFLNKGFGGVHRIPSTRESLGNLWFFLEGRPDVKNLVSDARDEGMVVLRVPAKPARPMSELVGVVDQAVKDSLELGAPAAKRRLEALARSFAVEFHPARVDEVVNSLAVPRLGDLLPEVDLEARRRVRAWLETPDSPYTPTDAQWAQFVAALDGPFAQRDEALRAAAAAIPEIGDNAPQFVETLAARLQDAYVAVRVDRALERLAPRAPEAFVVRASGVLTDLIVPHASSGEAAAVTVSGLPVVAAQIEADLLHGLWTALAWLLGVGAVALLLVTRRPLQTGLAVLAALAATAVTLAVVGTLGLGVDSGSASLFLVPAVAALMATGAPRATGQRAGFLVALAAAGLALLLVGLAPVSRIGAALAVGLGAVAVASQVVAAPRREPR